jgi:putative DeoR family transcriptional regulator (stage III sporulation protein D)
MFSGDIDERVREIAEYVSRTQSTVRAAAKHFGVSKSTVHKDLTDRLKRCDAVLYKKICKILEKNRAERHLRGGMATKRKYESAR